MEALMRPRLLAIVTVLAAVLALLLYAPAQAHHRPSHTKGPKPTAPTTAPTTTVPPPPGGCTNPQWTLTGNEMVSTNQDGPPWWFVHNNLWNPPPGGSQTTYACSPGSWYTVASGFPDSNFEVFSYPNAHVDFPGATCYPCGVPLSSFAAITSTFAGTPQDKGHFNVAYDLWVNGVGWGCGNTEVMIWTEQRGAFDPLGTDQGDYTIGGHTYDVWHYYDGCMRVVTYRSRAVQRSGALDLRQMLLDGVSRGFIPANPNLSAIDYGIEYRWTDGTSRFDVTDFTVNL